MASSIRLTNSGAPDTPPAGYARLYLEDFNGQLYLKMKRPDGSVQVFGTINTPLEITQGGTGLDAVPGLGQLLIGTGTGYRIGDITAGPGINILKDETTFQISSDISNIELVMPSEFQVVEQSVGTNNQFVVTKNTQSANSIYAGPVSGVDDLPVFRLLTSQDIPQLSKDKIVDFVEEVQDILAVTVENSASILFQYDDANNRIKSLLSDTGVVSGTYGESNTVPSIEVDAQGRIISVSGITIEILSTQISDIKEKIEDVVGDLIKDTDSINVEYNDVLSTLELNVKPEYLITTNISETENFRAPTSQAIKLYVDELVDIERTSRINEDANLTSRLDTFFENAPELLDTIAEIETRFNEVELSIVTQANANSQALTDAVDTIEQRLETIETDLAAEVDTRITEIQRVYDAITAQREVITLSSAMLAQPIELQTDLLSQIMPNSVVAFADRLGLFEDLDFTLSDGINNKVVLNLTPSALALLDGTEILRISYLTKI
jgi:hypothetical protein